MRIADTRRGIKGGLEVKQRGVGSKETTRAKKISEMNNIQKVTRGRGRPKQTTLKSILGDENMQTTLDRVNTVVKNKPEKLKVIPRKEYRTTYNHILRNMYVSFPKPKTRKDDYLQCECPADTHCVNCRNAYDRIECNPKCCLCGKECQNQRFRKRKYAKFSVCQAAGKGLGLFAAEDIEEGTLVVEYTGEVIDKTEMEERDRQRGKQQHWYTMAMGKGRYIDATDYGNEARFANHSCEPNCETQLWSCGNESFVGIFTLRDVAKGEELTFDYDLAPHKDKRRCLCGAPGCRGYL